METLEELVIENQEYRDHIATVDEEGKRVWVYPKKPKGFFHRWRKVFSYTGLALFFALPFIKIDGHEFMLFNLFERKFILFGTVFMPQDFHLFALAIIAFFVFVILFTVVFGRLWCGWACPQTIFMEMVFRKVEYLFEGDARQQRKLNARPWDMDKILRKTGKFSVFALIAIIVAHAVMAYIIGVDKVIETVTQSPAHNPSGFFGIVFFTSLFFFVFTYLREQACIVVCPYGRLQGVLLGKDSIVVAYDFLRGEPRGRLKKKKKQEEESKRELTLADFESPQGDCVDCSLCVQVCPTGIDIRNGTQLECVNCTACIDACDEVMEKIEKPKGLIRYASHNDIATGKKFKFTPRILAYSLVLVALLSLEGFLLSERSDIEATILRAPGSMYKIQPNGNITNIYSFQLTNKTFEDMDISFRLLDSKGKITVAGSNIVAEKSSSTSGALIIELPREEITAIKNSIRIEVLNEEGVIETVKTNFVGPVKR